MFNRKLYINKQKNGKVFVQFFSLGDISNEVNQEIIINVAKLFAKDFFVKLTSGNDNDNDIQSILNLYKNLECVSELKKNNYQFALQLTNEQLINVIRLVDCEKTSLELYACNGKGQLKDIFQTNFETDFYMYILDNDGPFILFNKKVYDFKETVNKIKTILKNQ